MSASSCIRLRSVLVSATTNRKSIPHIAAQNLLQKQQRFMSKNKRNNAFGNVERDPNEIKRQQEQQRAAQQAAAAAQQKQQQQQQTVKSALADSAIGRTIESASKSIGDALKRINAKKQAKAVSSGKYKYQDPNDPEVKVEEGNVPKFFVMAAVAICMSAQLGPYLTQLFSDSSDEVIQKWQDEALGKQQQFVFTDADGKEMEAAPANDSDIDLAATRTEAIHHLSLLADNYKNWPKLLACGVLDTFVKVLGSVDLFSNEKGVYYCLKSLLKFAENDDLREKIMKGLTLERLVTILNEKSFTNEENEIFALAGDMLSKFVIDKPELVNDKLVNQIIAFGYSDNFVHKRICVDMLTILTSMAEQVKYITVNSLGEGIHLPTTYKLFESDPTLVARMRMELQKLQSLAEQKPKDSFIARKTKLALENLDMIEQMLNNAGPLKKPLHYYRGETAGWELAKVVNMRALSTLGGAFGWSLMRWFLRYKFNTNLPISEFRSRILQRSIYATRTMIPFTLVTIGLEGMERFFFKYSSFNAVKKTENNPIFSIAEYAGFVGTSLWALQRTPFVIYPLIANLTCDRKNYSISQAGFGYHTTHTPRLLTSPPSGGIVDKALSLFKTQK